MCSSVRLIGSFRLLILCVVTLVAANVKADLNAKQARKAITRMAGFELTNGSVKIIGISQTGATSADVTALVRTAFRFEKDAQARWRVAEVRTGPNTWEDIAFIARSLGTPVTGAECNAAEPPARPAAIEPSVKRARCLLGSLLGIKVPSDAVRIQEVAPFAIPLASQPSTTIIAWIQVDARLVNQQAAGWQVSELRTGDRDWISLELVTNALNKTKREMALQEMTEIARALERFRSERGTYIVGDQHKVVIDHLSPHYLKRVIRLDPWHQPYSYEGKADRFAFKSFGPDRKEGTPDDIGLSHVVP